MCKIFLTLLLISTLSIFPSFLSAEPIVLSLNINRIDFGDIYTNSKVDSVLVDLTIKAENGRNYTVEISNNDNSSVLEFSRTAGGAYTTNSITYTGTGTGSNQLYEFYVVPKTAIINSDLSATTTVKVAYTDT